MKILVLASTYPRRQNDTEPNFIGNLCLYLARDDIIHVVTPHDEGIPTRESLSTNLEVFRFRYAPQRWETLVYNGGILANLKRNRLKYLLVPFFVIGQILLTIRLIRSNSYDIIHAHWIIPQGFVAIIARLFSRQRPAIILTSHGGDLFALKGALFSRLKRWIINASDHLTVVSSAMKDTAMMLGIPERKISVIPMGVDSYGTFFPSMTSAEREGLIFVGRLVSKKGIEYLLESMPSVLKRHPKQHLTIIGDGPLRTTLLELCRVKKIEQSVTFVGSIVNTAIPSYLQKAAIAIMPSVVTDNGDQDGAPVAIMETLACGCPTLVSDYPGARDIIVDGENGLLVRQKSSIMIAEKINYLLDNPKIRESLGKNGRESIQKKFDWQVVSAEFQAVFNKFVKS